MRIPRHLHSMFTSVIVTPARVTQTHLGEPYKVKCKSTTTLADSDNNDNLDSVDEADVAALHDDILDRQASALTYEYIESIFRR